MIIRPEVPDDVIPIHAVHCAAFQQVTEANLVNALRAAGAEFISLVALEENQLVGHILFTPVIIMTNPQNKKIAGLAPLGVLPDFHGRGIGLALAKTGLQYCHSAGFDAVIVLGDPAFYRKVGFLQANLFGLTCEFDAPPECFMAVELADNALKDCSGLTSYHPVFKQFED